MDIKKEITIKFTKDVYEKLRKFLLQNNLEQISYLFCNISEDERSIVILPQQIVLFKNDSKEEMLKKTQTHIWLDTDMVNEMYFRFIDSEYRCLINCHSHPFDSSKNVFFSGIDDQSDKKETLYFNSEITKGKKIKDKNCDIINISMVFGQQSIGARVYDNITQKFKPIDKIIVLEEPIKYIIPTNKKKSSDYSLLKKKTIFTIENIFNRQIMAFGEEGQKKLSELEVAIIGIGGIGSILVEGLCRLGVKKFVLIDGDKLELSNLNRWQGAKYKDIGKFKVDIATRNLKEMFPDIKVKNLRDVLFNKKAIDLVKNTDCILGCLDNHETRYLLNRLSLQYLIPYIDGSTIITTNDDIVTETKIRMGVVIPGYTRCLDCSEIEYYQTDKVREYFLDFDTRNNLEQNGYIKGSTEIKSPAVYPLNMSISGLMTFEFLNIFTGFKSIAYNTVLDLVNLDAKLKKQIKTEEYLEEKTGNCIICEDYKMAGDSEKLDYFLSRNKKIIY